MATQYDHTSKGELRVTVISGENLAKKDILSSDPYVRIGWPSRLDKHGFLEMSTKSPHIDSTLNPEWYFSTSYQLPHDDQGNKPEETLKVEVWDYDKASKDDFMGECYIKLTSERITGAVGKAWQLTLPLEPRKGHHDKVKGVIKVKLEFFPEGQPRQDD